MERNVRPRSTILSEQHRPRPHDGTWLATPASRRIPRSRQAGAAAAAVGGANQRGQNAGSLSGDRHRVLAAPPGHAARAAADRRAGAAAAATARRRPVEALRGCNLRRRGATVLVAADGAGDRSCACYLRGGGGGHATAGGIQLTDGGAGGARVGTHAMRAPRYGGERGGDGAPSCTLLHIARGRRGWPEGRPSAAAMAVAAMAADVDEPGTCAPLPVCASR